MDFPNEWIEVKRKVRVKKTCDDEENIDEKENVDEKENIEEIDLFYDRNFVDDYDNRKSFVFQKRPFDRHTKNHKILTAGMARCACGRINCYEYQPKMPTKYRKALCKESMKPWRYGPFVSRRSSFHTFHKARTKDLIHDLD